MVAQPYPTFFMNAIAEGDLRDVCEWWRSDNAALGWTLVATVRCNKWTAQQAPSPADPLEATAGESDVTEFRFPRGSAVRAGDRIVHQGFVYTVGAGDYRDTYATLVDLRAARPIASTPYQIVNFFEANGTFRGSSTVQLVLSNNQPEQTAEGDQIMVGWIFAVEGEPPIPARQGDIFDYGGLRAVVTWVPPDPVERREATFQVNVGSGA